MPQVFEQSLFLLHFEKVGNNIEIKYFPENMYLNDVFSLARTFIIYMRLEFKI